MKITDLDQRRPDLQRGMDLADHIVDDPRDILLEEIRLKAVEGTGQIFSEKEQSLFTLRQFGRVSCFQHVRMKPL